jgi:type III secretory pathway component EscS
VALVELARQALLLASTLSLPVLAASLAAGALVGFVSAVTRLQDGALAVLPRQLAVGAVLAFGGAAGFAATVRFAEVVWRAIPTLVP